MSFISDIFSGIVDTAKDVIGGVTGFLTPGVTGLATGAMSYDAQRETNAMNQANFNSAMAFNAAQADLNRQQQADFFWNSRDINVDNLAKVMGFNSAEADRARDFNAKQSAIAREFETEMANTAVRRRAADLEAAGFNPMLSFKSGTAADVPAGHSASSSAASASSHAQGGIGSSLASAPSLPHITSAVSSALEGVRVGSEIASRQQQYNIQEPVEYGAQKTLKGMKEVADRVPSVASTLDSATTAVGNIIETVQENLPAVQVFSAKAADRIKETVLEAAEDVKNRTKNAGGVVQRVLNSAGTAARRAAQWTSETANVQAGKFEGSAVQVLNQIAKIPDMGDRIQALVSFVKSGAQSVVGLPSSVIKRVLDFKWSDSERRNWKP